MWFRASQVPPTGGEHDRFRVSSIKNKISKRKGKPNSDPITHTSIESLYTPDTPETVSVENNIHIDANVPESPPPRPPPRKTTKTSEKQLLTDRKFKNNRIQKSSSKGKITDLSDKNAAAAHRKISAPPMAAPKLPPKKNNVRSYSNLTLNSLLKYKNYIGSSKKSTENANDEFATIRRKSFSLSSSHLNTVRSIDELSEINSTESNEIDDNCGSINTDNDNNVNSDVVDQGILNSNDNLSSHSNINASPVVERKLHSNDSTSSRDSVVKLTSKDRKKNKKKNKSNGNFKYKYNFFVKYVIF